MDLPNQAQGAGQKLAIEQFADDNFTYMRLGGAIDEHFDGKKLSASVKTRILVLHLAGIDRMSSFGIREWGDFIEGLAKNVEQLVLIECSPKVMDQLNMVANFIGSGRVLSFYAPYRCDYCDSDNRVLLQVDRDWDMIKGRKPPELPCSSCGELEHFDEDPITYFSYMANQGPFELDPEIRVLLTSASKLDSAIAEVDQRLHVDKVVEGRFTSIKLSGDLNASFPRTKLAEGLEGTIIVDLSGLGKLDPAGAAEWRTFLQMITPLADAIYLTGMPQLFLEKLGTVADMGAKTQLLSFSMLYACTRCGVTAPYIVDVDKHHDVLRFATAPEMNCRDCKAPAICQASRELLYQLSALPRPGNVPQRVRAALESTDRRKPTRSPTRSDAGKRGKSRFLFIMGAVLLLAVLAGGGVFGWLYFKHRGQPGVSPHGVGPRVQASAGERPPWILSDTPLAAECKTDSSFKMSCMGVSSYAASAEEASQEARDAAVDAVVRAIGLLIEDPEWSTHVGAAYSRVRQAKIAAFFDEGLRAPGSLQHQRAQEALQQSRRAVIKALRRTGNNIVPIDKPSEQYQEQYAPGTGTGPRHLTFVRIQLSADDVRKLLDVYSRPREALGATVMTAYPGLAWRYPEIEAGAVITELGKGPLKDAGAAPGQVITAIGGRMIADADAFVRMVEDQLEKLGKEGGALQLTVAAGEGGAGELSVEIKAAEDDDEDSD